MVVQPFHQERRDRAVLGLVACSLLDERRVPGVDDERVHWVARQNNLAARTPMSLLSMICIAGWFAAGGMGRIESWRGRTGCGRRRAASSRPGTHLHF